jgi:galactokinase
VSDRVHVFAPGRVNLIGEHTDYAGGLVLPIAIDLGTTLIGQRGHDRVVLVSGPEHEPAEVTLDGSGTYKGWARFVAAVVAELAPAHGVIGEVATTLPVGAGLSSSAALEVAVALAIVGEGEHDRLALAKTLQRAEMRATGVPSGVMDQLASLCGVEGNALLIDCTTLAITNVAVPDDIDVVVLDSGERRTLETSAYAERRQQVEAAAAIIGPLSDATLDDVTRIDDPVVRKRARHVVSENARVRAFVAELARGGVEEAGAVLYEGHRSLRDDMEVTSAATDALVERLARTDGVYGARLTGAGWGGCVVALTEPGAVDIGWHVRASDGARVTSV